MQDMLEGQLSKQYVLVPGVCSECTLEFNCRSNKKELMRFLESLGLKPCGDGKRYKVEENSNK